MLDSLILGKKTPYPSQYTPGILQAIPRQLNRDRIAVKQPLPFYGCDIWNAYELSWLNPKGKPIVAVGRFTIPCASLNLVESKTFKLYLNSLNNERYESVDAIKSVMQRDLEACLQSPLQIEIFTADNTAPLGIGKLTGTCIDNLDVTIDNYSLNPELLRTKPGVAEELLYSDLLKSNCPITDQPDWGSIQIYYRGPMIDHASLLAYIVSYRHHQEFRECCVERIFTDIQRQCHPEELTIYVCESRRGGLDINPYRSTNPNANIQHQRLWRQ